MNDIEVSSIDLVEGGNVFKQGHYLTLGYVPRDEKGETVDLSGKTLNVSLWGRKGVVFEAAAIYSAGVIRFTFDKMVAAGDYTVEFTVTSSTDAEYRKKFPTNQHSGRIAIKQSADDLGVVGIQVYTVAQLKAEQKAIQTQYESTVDAKVQASDAKSTTALTKSTTAEATANDVKSQFEQVVISGDSSVEAAAARVAPDQTFVSLKARLDAKEQATALQLAETSKQAYSTVSHNIDRNVIVSFVDDDGNKKVMSIMKPLFDSENVPATVAVVTDKTDVHPDFMTTSDLLELKESGWTVGQHTHTHIYMGDSDEATNEYELSTAKKILDDKGLDGDIIVYPYGSRSDVSRKVTRRHCVVGLGGYNEYNMMPIDTYNLKRFFLLSENEFDLAACQKIIDEAPDNSWIIFYTHINSAMFLEQTTIDKYRSLIQYIKAANIDIVNVRDGLDRKGNIVDVGDAHKFYKVGRDGSTLVNDFDRTDFDSTTPIGFFPKGMSRVYFPNAEATSKGFPGSLAGIITTYRPTQTSYNNQDTGAYQTYEIYDRNRVYRRRWDFTAKVWGAWEILAEPLKDALNIHYVNSSVNSYKATDLNTAFPNDKITTFYFNYDGRVGFPCTSGIVSTYRLGGIGWNKQEVREYNGAGLWTRYNITGGWSPWVKYATELTLNTFVGEILIGTTFRPLTGTVLAKYIDFERIYSTGGSQPILSKSVWAASEISTDIASPTTIGTVGALNVHVYQDTAKQVFIKYSGSGNSFNAFVKASYC